MWVAGLHAAHWADFPPWPSLAVGRTIPSESQEVLRQAPLARPECALASVAFITLAPVGRYLMNRMVHEAVAWA